MTGLKKNMKLTFQSTLSLILVYFLLLVFQWVIMLFGAWISGFEGQINYGTMSPIPRPI